MFFTNINLHALPHDEFTFLTAPHHIPNKNFLWLSI